MYNTGEFRFLKVKSENIFEEYFLSFLKVNILQNEMLPQNLFFFSHTKKKVVDCGLWNVGPLLFNGCAKFAAYWQDCEAGWMYC